MGSLPLRAYGQKRALRVERIPRAADLPPEPDHVEVQRHVLPLRDIRLKGKRRPGEIGRGRDQTKPFCHPQDMRVHGKRFPPEGEQQEDVRRLHPDAGKGGKPGARFGKRHLPEKIEREFSLFPLQPGERRKDRLRFSLRPPPPPHPRLPPGGESVGAPAPRTEAAGDVGKPWPQGLVSPPAPARHAVPPLPCLRGFSSHGGQPPSSPDRRRARRRPSRVRRTAGCSAQYSISPFSRSPLMASSSSCRASPASSSSPFIPGVAAGPISR